MTEAPTNALETITCSRCGGTGHYSYNQINGTTCFKCGGQKKVYTKRGAAAKLFLNNLRKKPAKEIKVGDLVLFDMFSFKVYTPVTEIKEVVQKYKSLRPGETKEEMDARDWEEMKKIELSAIRAKTGEQIGIYAGPDEMITMGFTGEEKQAQLKLAIEYQSTLTAAGTVKKRKG